jgi:serine/threonine protein kinase
MCDLDMMLKKGNQEFQEVPFSILEYLINFRIIVTAVDYIHNLNIMHTDLNPNNIFISLKN